MSEKNAPEPRARRGRSSVTPDEILLAAEHVAREGFDALTMQRLADQCDSAIGAVYRYFPSKGALVAEVQREAIERISMALAAAERVARTSASPAWEMRPGLSFSPDWKRLGVRPK